MSDMEQPNKIDRSALDELVDFIADSIPPDDPALDALKRINAADAVQDQIAHALDEWRKSNEAYRAHVAEHQAAIERAELLKKDTASHEKRVRALAEEYYALRGVGSPVPFVSITDKPEIRQRPDVSDEQALIEVLRLIANALIWDVSSGSPQFKWDSLDTLPQEARLLKFNSATLNQYITEKHAGTDYFMQTIAEWHSKPSVRVEKKKAGIE